MNRYEAILTKCSAAQHHRLETAAAADRSVGQAHGVGIAFFGTYARGRTGPESDLDVLILDEIPEMLLDAVLRDIEWTGSRYDVAANIICAWRALHLVEEAIP